MQIQTQNGETTPNHAWLTPHQTVTKHEGTHLNKHKQMDDTYVTRAQHGAQCASTHGSIHVRAHARAHVCETHKFTFKGI